LPLGHPPESALSAICANPRTQSSRIGSNTAAELCTSACAPGPGVKALRGAPRCREVEVWQCGADCLNQKRPEAGASGRFCLRESGSGGGIRERALLAMKPTAGRPNPRPPGYEKVSAFPKTIETSKSYRLTKFSRCAGWGSLRRIDPRVTPPLN
jgi:hypothetical protein